MRGLAALCSLAGLTGRASTVKRAGVACVHMNWRLPRMAYVGGAFRAATGQEQAVALATGKLKVVVVVNQQYPPTKVTNVALATI